MFMKKCDTCDFQQECYTEGVHVLETGLVRVYSEDDEFCCSNCDGTKNVAEQYQESKWNHMHF